MQDPLPYTPSIYPAGASAGVHGSLPSSELLAPDSRLVTRLQDLTLNSSWLPGVLSSGLQMQDLLPYPPSIYPAGAPAGVHGGLPGSEILAQILAQILALNSSWLPGSDLPTCYPASSRVVCKRKAHYLIPRALTRRPLERSANARPITSYPEHLPGWCARWGSRRLTRLQTFGSRLPTGYPAPTSQPAKRNALNHARELTRLAHPAPDGMSRGSLSLGLPIGGCRAAATYSAGGPVGPTP